MTLGIFSALSTVLLEGVCGAIVRDSLPCGPAFLFSPEKLFTLDQVKFLDQVTDQMHSNTAHVTIQF